MQSSREVVHYLKSVSSKEVAVTSQRFFKTGKGEYGYGDLFLGIRVPEIRKAVRNYKELPLSEVILLLQSQFHEIRLFALLALVNQFKSSDEKTRKTIFDAYLKNAHYINSWDLVDASAHHIVGAWLYNKKKNVLYKLVKSNVLWERRISILATLYFIKRGEYEDTLKLSFCLLNDKEDLIHKAAGWMLREVGNRNRKTEEDFLKSNYRNMPRTMLRYAIEKFTQERRSAYLKTMI